MFTKLFGISPIIIAAGIIVLFLVLFFSSRKVLLWYWKLDEISRTLKEILEELKKKTSLLALALPALYGKQYIFIS